MSEHDTIRPKPLPHAEREENGTRHRCVDSIDTTKFDAMTDQEQRRQVFIASYLAVEHSLEALHTVQMQTRQIKTLTDAAELRDKAVEAYALRVDCLISDMRDHMMEHRCQSTNPPAREPARSYSDLQKCETDGGTERFFGTRDQLREIARSEIKQEREAYEKEKDARPMRWWRGTARPHLVLVGLTAAATVAWVRLWAWVQTLPKLKP